jgi:hypothetical protein
MESSSYQTYLVLIMGFATAGAIGFLYCAARELLKALGPKGEPSHDGRDPR